MAPPFVSSIWKDSATCTTNVWQISPQDLVCTGNPMVSQAKPVNPVMFDSSLPLQPLERQTLMDQSAASAVGRGLPSITKTGVDYAPVKDQTPVSTKSVSLTKPAPNQPLTQNLLSTAKSVSRNDILHGVSAVLEHFVSMSDQEFIVPPPTPFDGPEYKTTSIFSKLEQIMNSGVCSKECFIIAVIFGERLLQSHPNFHISRYNVHRLILVSIMVASKILDDFYCRNAYYANVGGLDTKKLNELELKLTFMLDFRLAVDLEEFSLYCSALIRDPTQISAGSWTGPSEGDVVAKQHVPQPVPVRPVGAQPFPHPGPPAYGIPQQPPRVAPGSNGPAAPVYVTPAGQGYTLLHPHVPAAPQPATVNNVSMVHAVAPVPTSRIPKNIPARKFAPPPPSQNRPPVSCPNAWQQQHQHQCQQQQQLLKQRQQHQQRKIREIHSRQQRQQQILALKQQTFTSRSNLPFPPWNPPSAHSLPQPPAGWLLTPAGV